MENIQVALIRNGEENFIYSAFKKSVFQEIVEDIKNNKFNIIELPKPLDDIKVVWYNEGYENFIVQIRKESWERIEDKLVPMFSEQKVTGSAIVITYDDGKYKGLSQEAFKRLIDCDDVIFNFNKLVEVRVGQNRNCKKCNKEIEYRQTAYVRKNKYSDSYYCEDCKGE